MAKINTKLIKYATQARFDIDIAKVPAVIDSKSIVFVENTGRIYAHGKYFGGAWEDITDKPKTFAPAAHTLGSHSDVTLTSLAANNILKWSGSKWVNNTLAQAGIATPADISTAIDDLEIGGRNLVIIGTSVEGKYVSPSTGELRNSGAGASATDWIKVSPNSYYTYSVFPTIHIYPGKVEYTIDKEYISGYEKNQPVANGLFIDTFKTSPTTHYIRVANGALERTKLEKGTKATAWSPAPEDQISDWNTTDATSFSFIKNKPTTLAGYGITDGVTLNTTQTITGAKTFNTTTTIRNIIVGNGSGNQIDRLNGILYLQHASTNHLALVNGGGNVGIGTASPAYKLDVSGTGRFTGSVTAPSFIGNASSASAVSTSADNSSTTSRYILFADNASGNQALKTDTGLKYVPSTNTISANISGNLSGGTVNGTALGVTNVSASTGLGLSLYGGPTTGIPQYGMVFAGTPTFGTHGAVTGDWATYFTMTGATSRGWIFKLGTTNVASISAAGVVTATTFSGNLTGNVTGNVSGSAGSTTNWAGNTYANSNITNEVYLMTSTNGTYWRRTLANRYVDTTSTQSIGGVKTFTDTLRVLTTPSGGITAKILCYPTNAYGLVFRSLSSGNHSIQSQRESNDTEVYTLSLNPNGGNVGIGTTSPGQKLDVNGNVKATSFLGKATSAGTADLANTLTINSSASASWFNILWNSGTTVYGSASNKLRVQPSTGSITSGGTITASGGNSTQWNSAYGWGNHASQGYASGKVLGAINIPPNQSGWYKVAKLNRGAIKIQISTTGGSWVPDTYSIDFFKDWSTGTNLQLQQHSSTNYFSKARITGNSTTGYLELYANSGSAGVEGYIYRDSLQGYNTNTEIFTGDLELSNETTVLGQEMSFEKKGLSILGNISASSFLGNATTATALTTNAGSATQPVYFSGGKPAATTYSLGKSVPSNAVFTDTYVKQDTSTTTSYRPILLGQNSITSSTSNFSNVTNQSYYSNALRMQPSTGNIISKGSVTATSFIGNASSANKVNNKLILKFDTGTTENTSLYTYDGSAAKTIDIKAGSNVSFDKAANTITINSTNTNTTYSALSVADGKAGTATASRTVRADYLKEIIQYYDTNSVTGIRAGASGTTTNSSTSNPYIKVLDDSTYRSQIRLSGSGATSVSSDVSGNITISSTNTDTTYLAGTKELIRLGTDTSNRVWSGKTLKEWYLEEIDILLDSNRFAGSTFSSDVIDLTNVNGAFNVNSVNNYTAYTLSSKKVRGAWAKVLVNSSIPVSIAGAKLINLGSDFELNTDMYLNVMYDGINTLGYYTKVVGFATPSYYISTSSALIMITNTPMSNFNNSTTSITIDGTSTSKDIIQNICLADEYSSITSIGNNFLYRCTRLKSVELSAMTNVTSIGNTFLSNCVQLKSVDLSTMTNVTSIGIYFLNLCKSLESVDLSALTNLTSIGGYFLQNCSSLTLIDLSALTNLTSIGNNFLQNCSSLTLIDLSAMTNLTSIGSSFLSNCSSLTLIDLSAMTNVTSIGNTFLSNCVQLKSVDLSTMTNVTSIGSSFLLGSAVETLKMGAIVPPSLSETLPSTITSILVPSVAVNAYKAASYWSAKASIITGY